MSPESQCDVLIIGAGPVGLTLANELLRHRIRPRIIDRAPAIREVSKAMILHVRTQEVLNNVGIMARIQQESAPLREVVVHAYGKHIGSWDLDHIDSPFTHPVILGQNRTQHALLDLFAGRGGQVDWNAEAVSVSVDENGATTVVRCDGRDDTVRTSYVVGCEGSNSLVRQSLNLSFAGERYSGEQFIQADCRLRWDLPAGRSYLFLTAAGYLMVIEFPGGMVRVFISLPDRPDAEIAANEAGAVEAVHEQPTLDEIAAHLTVLTGFACKLSDAVWLARYRTSHRYADRFAVGRAFVAGDAAHVHVPIGGQGMNTGIQDAFNLGWKLAGVLDGSLRPSILDSYHAERNPVAASLINGTDIAYKGVLHPSEIRQHAARLFGPFLMRSARVQDVMRGTLEELNVFYTDTPINLDLGGAGGPAPGERVLDAAVVRATDQTTTSLIALLRIAGWTVLLFGGLNADEIADRISSRFGSRVTTWLIRESQDSGDNTRTLIDRLRIAHGRYGVTGPAFFLLRPDTYVAARGPLSASDRLVEHLDTIFS
jgi:3-(3-hydroxy-phenyl)propionate hydroxylase